MIMNQNVFMDFQENIKGYIGSYLQKAKENSFNLGSISEKELTKVFLVVLNIVDTQVHHHLFREQIFDSDEELVDYLAKLFQFTLQQYLIM